MMIINLLGVALIFLIIWWFWLYQPKQTVVQDDELVIEVKDGIYSPALIEIAADKPLTLKFHREDQSPCAEMLLIPSLGISENLTLNSITPIKLPKLTAGEYQFHCQMQMYRGVIKVV